MSRERKPQGSKRTRELRRLGPGVAVRRIRGDQWDSIRTGRAPMPSGTCISGKVRYATREDATRALELVRRAREASGSTLMEKRVYRCDRDGCNGWHMTKLAEWGPQ